MENRNWTLLIGIVVLAVIAGGMYYWQKSKPADTPAPVTTTPVVYDSSTDGLSFSYPSSYKLDEHQLDITTMKGKYLTLTPKNVQVPQDSEGPPGLTVEIFENPRNTALADWLKEITSGTPPVEGASTTSIAVAGEPGIKYQATGLYESDNVATKHGTHIYVFSASWLTRQDQTLRDLDTLLSTVQFK
jgi:hypothetical protein